MYTINEIADAVIHWKGTRDIVIGNDYVEFKRGVRPHVIKLSTTRYEGHSQWRLFTGGIDYSLPHELGIRIATTREAAEC